MLQEIARADVPSERLRTTGTILSYENAALQPASWWRRLCEVTDRLYVCGDLPQSGDGFAKMLTKWVDEGITHIVDVRGECSDEAWVAETAPHINYSWHGTHDAGGEQNDAWFDEGVKAVTKALETPKAKVVVHCHMGVNRAPSMAYAVLLQLGYGIEEGLHAIRDARPIAAILYADSAIRWFGGRDGWNHAAVIDAQRRVELWHQDNPIDVGWVINRIHVSEWQAA